VCRTDEQCIRDCLDGHPEFFRHLVARHQAALMVYLRRQVGEGDEATEAAQESFVRAYFALPSLKKPGSFVSWLLGIADRVVKETWRWKKQHQSVAFDDRQVVDASEQSGEMPDLDVSKAVSRLPEVYRETVFLRYYERLSCAQIGERLDVPIGTVTKRLSRAYSLLREYLGEDDVRKDMEVES
jgi:RNA polymerase sigma-70 factor, ECF subfamily